MHFKTRRVTDAQLPRAFSVLTETAQWLQRQGRRQRITNTSYDLYEQWQATQANYAVWVDDSMVGIFSIPVESFSDWPEFAKHGPAIWLRALATHPDFRHQKVGEFAIQSALQLAGPGNPLFLDCVSGFLPNYYHRRGFETVAEKSRDYGDEGTYQITLMRHLNH